MDLPKKSKKQYIFNISIPHSLTSPISQAFYTMDEILRDYGAVTARIGTYGLDEGRMLRLQQSAYCGHYGFLQEVHSLALNRRCQSDFRTAIDRHYLFQDSRGVSDDVKDSRGVSAGVVESSHSGDSHGVSADVVEDEVISPEAFAILHMNGKVNGRGLSKTGMFTISYWSKGRSTKKPYADSWDPEVCPIVAFRSTTLEDLNNPSLKTTPFPPLNMGKLPPSWHKQFQIAYLSLKMVGMDTNGDVYRAPNECVMTTSSLPHGFTNAMYVEAVKVFFKKRAAIENTGAKASAATLKATQTVRQAARAASITENAKKAAKQEKAAAKKAAKEAQEAQAAKEAQAAASAASAAEEKRKRTVSEEVGQDLDPKRKKPTHELYNRVQHKDTDTDAEIHEDTDTDDDTDTDAEITGVTGDTEETFRGVVDQLLGSAETSESVENVEVKGKGKAKAKD